MAGSKSRKRSAADAQATDAEPQAALARTAAAEAVARAAAPTSIEIDGKQCLHEVAWPRDWAGPAPLQPPKARPGPAARDYPFKLDPFQQVAVNCLEAGHSVLVAAHTSAGKTVVAEYAFAMALRDQQRVIYTSPLKALSNQKYRQLCEEFQDVGLLTGDVTINSEASCLVMTTEILRSMLINGSEIVREAAWIVFDEVHYLRDKERGVVWEQAIIMAPPSVRLVFLSATLPNGREFASWIANTHGGPCHVVTTNYRPTPLQHYLFPAGGDGLQLVVDEAGTFHETNFQKVMAAVSDSRKDRDQARSKKDTDGVDEETDIFKIIRMILQRGFDPVIVFSFSKNECEKLATRMKNLDLLDNAEKALVEGVFNSAVELLSSEDAKLPQIHQAIHHLKRGVGVHHSGLLPLLKEITEILFQEGLLKVLFATETFSTGLNMPARTVVFTNTRKFDGAAMRWLTPGEYIQMSGRAGRRGIDDRGMVILMTGARMEPGVAKDMLQGQPDALRSEFNLSYAMMLGLARGQALLDIEALLAKSFRQAQAQNGLPALRQRMHALQAQAEAVSLPQEEQVESFQATLDATALLRSQIRTFVHSPAAALPFLQAGRLVRLLAQAPDDTEASSSGRDADSPPDLEEACVWGALVGYKKQAAKGTQQRKVVIDVLVKCSHASFTASGPKRRPLLVGAAEEGRCLVCALPLEDLVAFSSLRIYLDTDLKRSDTRAKGLQAVAEVEKRFKEGVPLLDPAEDQGIKDSALRKAQRKLEAAEGLRDKHTLAGSPDLGRLLSQLHTKRGLQQALKSARQEEQAAQSTVLLPELQARRRVLQRLGYVDADGLVSNKGQVAAHIQSADELVLTELVFAGGFQGKPPPVIVAMLSCFLWQESSEKPPALPITLNAAHKEVQRVALIVGKVLADSRLGVDANEYVQRFRPEVMEVFHAWATGHSFKAVLALSDFYEGSIVRTVRRCEELLRQLIDAAKVIGEHDLAEQFGLCVESIKRDIVFAASLYL